MGGWSGPLFPMSQMELLYVVWQQRTLENYLLKKAGKHVVGILVIASLVTAIDVGDSDARVMVKSCKEMINNTRGKNCFPRPWYARTEQGLPVFVKETPKFGKLKKPLPCAWVSFAEVVTL
jgi:hypothetical protein